MDTPDHPPAPSPASSRRAAVAGGLIGVAAAGAVALPLLVLAYGWGRNRGAVLERQRTRVREAVVCPADAPDTSATTEATADNDVGEGALHASNRTEAQMATAARTQDVADAPPKRRAIALHALDCVRLTWPMELLQESEAVDHPHIRLREGANRFAHPGRGVCEFAFRTRKAASVTLYVRCRGMDECSNSLLCRVNGGRFTYIPFGKQYGEWCWRPAYRRFHLQPGLHRLTLQASEDGIVFDRVVLTSQPPTDPATIKDKLDRVARKPAPRFDRLPLASPTLSAIGGISAEAMPIGSLMIGKGHTNTLTVFLRLNREAPAKGEVRLRSRRGRIEETHPFALTDEDRVQLLTLPLAFRPYNVYLVPLSVEVFADGRRIHYQRVDFLKPLAWAFAGPFPDPEGHGLDRSTPVDAYLGELRHLPEIPDHPWTVIEDGSCYNALGVVDLNKVFGLPNRPRRGKGTRKVDPQVAVAVTCVPSFPNNHQSLAYGADDCLQAWINGEPLLRVDANVPLELSRQVVGTHTGAGRNTFVFKVAQTESYWQLLFEPDWNTPYGLRDFLIPLPVEKWGE